jgi:hypothetical protein
LGRIQSALKAPTEIISHTVRLYHVFGLLGLLLVMERRIPRRKSLTNIVTVISNEWLSWFRLTIGAK